MKRKTKLRLISLAMLAIAVVFLFCAVSCPTLGHVFYLGPFRIAAEQWRVFYKLYAAITVGLFLLSFLIRERKPEGSEPAPETTFEQLNHGWNADPNAAEVQVRVFPPNIAIRFPLNTLQFPQFHPGDEAVLTFHSCLQYRLGPPNDEGFFVLDQSRFRDRGVQWGEFYQVHGSDWRESFPDPIPVSPQPEEALRHYLFYFKDGTFECLALSYDLRFVRGEAKETGDGECQKGDAPS